MTAGEAAEADGELEGVAESTGTPPPDEREALAPSANEVPDDQLTIEFGRSFGDGRYEVFVKQGDDLVLADRFSIVSKRSRDKFIESVIAKVPGLDEDAREQVEATLMQQAEAPPERGAGQPPPAPKSPAELVQMRDESAQEALRRMDERVVATAEELLESPELLARIQSSLELMGVVGESTLRLTLYLVGTSRLLPSPLSAIVFGPSSAGKSHVIAKVADLFPPEAVLRATDITPNALYYMEETALVHTFVVAGERARREDDEQAEATRALREMLSEGVLRKVIPEKSSDGNFTTTPMVRYGPIAFVESTTLPKVFNEDSNRALTLAVDESPEQTRRVMEHSARVAMQGLADIGPIVEIHHALQRLLRRVDVIIPFAKRIADHIPSDRPEARRACVQVWSVVRAVASLRQRQRCGAGMVLEHGDAITATLDDYEVAREVLVEALGRALGSDLTPAIRRFGERVVETYPTGAFTAVDSSKRDKTIKDAEVARRYLKTLAEAGVVEVLEHGRGGKPNRYKVIGRVPLPGEALLPTVEELLAAGADASNGDVNAVRLVASVEDHEESTSAAAVSEDGAQPVPAVRLGAPGGQPQPSDEERESWRTKRTKADQDPQLPDSGDADAQESEFPADNQTHQGELIEGSAPADWDEQDFGFLGAPEKQP